MLSFRLWKGRLKKCRENFGLCAQLCTIAYNVVLKRLINGVEVKKKNTNYKWNENRIAGRKRFFMSLRRGKISEYEISFLLYYLCNLYILNILLMNNENEFNNYHLILYFDFGIRNLSIFIKYRRLTILNILTICGLKNNKSLHKKFVSHS